MGFIYLFIYLFSVLLDPSYALMIKKIIKTGKIKISKCLLIDFWQFFEEKIVGSENLLFDFLIYVQSPVQAKKFLLK